MLAGVPEVEWTQVLRARHAAIARAQFHEVAAIATIYLTRCADDERRGCNEAFQGEFASAEIGVMFRWTEVTAQRVIGLGIDLRWRLHATSAEFAAGRIDQARAHAISDALANVSEDKVGSVEKMLLDGSEHLNLPKLRAKARRLIARHDPDGAKARREAAEADRDVRFRANGDGTCTLDGTLPGPGGQVVAMRLRRMCFEVCCHDPRTFAQRRADALVALASGAGFLHCACGRGDCAATAPRPDDAARTPTPPADGADAGPGSGGAESETSTASFDPVAARAPESATESVPTPLAPLPKATIHVGVNLTTLLGLDDLPGHLAGHGFIDADLAREIAADGTWRRVLTLTDTDREALLDALCGHTGTGERARTGTDERARTGAGEQAHTGTDERGHAGVGERGHTGVGERVVASATAGSPDPARPPHIDGDPRCGVDSRTADSDDGKSDITVPEADSSISWLSGRRAGTLAHGTLLGIGRALKAAGITPAAIRERSRIRRDQLTYRPSARLAEMVRARDGGCRFPGCNARAAGCDLDHTIPFDHAHPERGGLTVEQNLACLCRRHHRLKTRGLWKVRQLGGGRLEWTTPTGELAFTHPDGAFVDPDTERAAHEALAAAHGRTLTDETTLAALFGPHRGHGVEADLHYLIDTARLIEPIAVIPDHAHITILDMDDRSSWPTYFGVDHSMVDPAPF